MANAEEAGCLQAATAPLKCVRWLWVAVFVVASALLALHLHALVKEYQQYPVLVKSYQKVQQMMKFPAVTICNLNSLKKSKLRCSPMSELARLDQLPGGKEEPCGNKSTKASGLLAEYTDAFGSGDSGEEYEGSGVGEGYGGSDAVPQLESALGEVSTTDKAFEEPENAAEDVTEGNDTNSNFDAAASENGPYNYEDGYSSWENLDEYSEWSDEENGSGFFQDDDVDYYKRPELNLREGKLLSRFVNELNSNRSDTAFRNLIRSSKTGDFTDVRGLLIYTPKQTKDYGYSKLEMILQCSFDRTPCKPKDFDQFYSNRHGNCYTFNSKLANKQNKVRVTRMFGPESGLKITVNVNTSEYIGFLAEDYGVKVVIHPPDQFPDLDGMGYVATIGTKTSASIKRSSIKRKPSPYESHCASEIPSAYQPHTQVPRNALHSTRACLLACEAKHIHDCCNCTVAAGAYPSLMGNRHSSFFNVFDPKHVQCRDNVTRRLLLGEKDPERLTCDCRAACREENYHTSLFHSVWPTDSLQGMIAYNIPLNWSTILQATEEHPWEPEDYEDLNPLEREKEKLTKFARENLVRLHMFYEHFTEQVVEEYAAITLSQIFANVGGTMGLYMGLSILTFLEITQFLVFYLWSKVAMKPQSGPRNGAGQWDNGLDGLRPKLLNKAARADLLY